MMETMISDNNVLPAKGNILGKCLPARYIFAVLGCIGMAIVYGLKICLSVAMVAMVNHTAIEVSTATGDKTDYLNKSEECASSDTDSSGIVENGPFIWDTTTQGVILSCYFWGYLVSQIPCAMIAEKYSAKWVFFFSVAINVICTLLTPVLTKAHYSGLIIMRVLEGIGGGASFPSMHCLIASWAPPNEVTLITAIIYAGTALGTAKSILISGILASNFGWESVFYVMGGLSCIWMLLWIVLVQDNPNKQTLISQTEREYITTELGTTKGEGEKKALPWGKILKSIPFWAIVTAHFCGNFGWYMLLIETPFYMKQILKFNVSSNAIMSAIPYYPLWIFTLVLSKTLDTLRAKEIITTTLARKIATSITSLIPAICLLILCFIGCHPTAAVVIMGIAVTAMGAMFCGYLANHIDLAPNYAGSLVALTNTIATIPGIIVPLFVGILTKGNQTIEAWRIIFFTTIALFFIEFIVYNIFGSGKQQKWNNQKEER